MFVDDVHLLDSGSATLVHQLAVTRAATVLMTVRSGEVAPDPVVALWKDGPAERIELGVLGDAAVEELLVKALGGPVDAASVRQLAEAAHFHGRPAQAERELAALAADAASDGERARRLAPLRQHLPVSGPGSRLAADR